MKWTCEDEKTVCKFYLKHKKELATKHKNYKKRIAELTSLLSNKFSQNSVRLKVENFKHLDTGSEGMSNYSFLSKFTYRNQTKRGKKTGLSKAAKGIQTADVANAAVRNILTIISIHVGDISADDMKETNKFFNYKCPYIGRDLTKEIQAKEKGLPAPGIELDHIVPQNDIFCGLNVKGNMVWVDKAANQRKKKRDFITFISEDKDIVASTTLAERQDRIDKIKDFQRICNYDPDKIARVLSPLLQDFYAKIQLNQIETAAELIAKAKL